jgi:large subunit ribosomal protein L3
MSQKFILGEKMGMSRLYSKSGIITPVTVVSVLQNTVSQVKAADKDGYEAVQLGYGRKKHLAKPQKGHLKDLGDMGILREFRVKGGELKRGDKVELTVFAEGDEVCVAGLSKGKGFAGVVKRHGLRGGPGSHGHPHNLRAPGSVGCRFPQHIHKNKRMAGHMGVENVTVRNLEIIKVDADNQLLAVKGAIPGARGTLVRIYSNA